MQFPPFLQGVIAYLQGLPRMVLFAGILVPIFLGTVLVTLATSGGDGNDEPEFAINPTITPSTDNIDAPATPTRVPATATAAPTNTPAPTPEPPNREDCNAIQGTQYESPEEREWYLANCLNTNTATTDPGGGGGAAGGGGGAAGGGGGGGHVSGVEYALGATLVIPSIGLNATVTGMDVGPSGAMPDPNGYFNAVQYFFPNHPGLGVPNIVLAGHVDCARCHGGGSGTAVFWSVRDLAPGATAQYYGPDGSVRNFVVVSSYAVPDGTDFSGIVSSGAAGMTLITCTGTFGGGHYNQRHVVAFAAQ